VKDVTQLLQDFEEHNDVTVRVSFRVEKLGKAPGIVMNAEAYENPVEGTGLPLLASVSVRCLDMNLRHWGAAVTHLLYVLDSAIARQEMARAESKRA